MRIAQVLVGGLLAGFGMLCVAVFYDRYWRWRDCFNELGRCFDSVSQDVYLEQSGLARGGLAAFFILAGLCLVFWRPRAHRRTIY